ncbi:MAG: DNA polymerase III subunit alpha, partial [Deltaproteobacteria bacterium]|nr:DNA polymerase III subunit alpha [Deltaproteobacteria bacterium]
MSTSFTHLHLHSQYSLLDGAIRLKSLPAALKERGFDGCALTDHGNLFGAVEFFGVMKKAGLKPIIGMEAYVAVDSRHNRKYDRPGPNAMHLVLLCQNRIGYQNLIRLSSLAFLEGKYYGVPRLDRELLEQHNEGLIALSACLSGVISRPLIRPMPQLEGDDPLAAAREAAHWYGQVFDGRFYVELQNHGLPEEKELNPTLVEIARLEGLPLVGTNDCHYLNPDEGYPHYLLQLIGWQRKVTDYDTEPYSDKNLHLKNLDEMRETLAGFPPEALENTVKIAEQCDLDLSCNTFYLPRYEIPPEFTVNDWLRKEAAQGLEQRLKNIVERYGIPQEDRDGFRAGYDERLQFELDVICKMNYAGYFLIVAEFINWGKNHNVRVGPGRGSGAGSLVAYALRITDLDPIHHGLLFERFLNPERVSLPDFDIDFDVQGRERVIEHVRDKYGSEKVCQISTFGSLGAKAALRNVARVLSFPYSHADKIAKLIPDKLGITLQEAIDLEPELARMEREGEQEEQTLIACGKALEGLNSNLSTHAAGVIIMDADIQEIMPVCTSSKNEGGIQSQYSMKSAEMQGAVKFDFLGLLNLTIIKDAMELINGNLQPGQEPLDIDSVPLDDRETYTLLSRADTTGVFQLESGGMRRLLGDLKPERFEDLVAILALYRPGPLGSGMTDDFVKRKNGQPYEPMHPLLEPVLSETYGVMAYQEQVMEAARVMAGYSLGEADLLRRAIGKKIPEEMASQREQFVARCVEREVDQEKAEEIFEKIDYFSGYGFNKSHSAAYGLIAYQTAYLKAHYPVEFMAALLSSDMDNTDKVVSFIADCREMDIQVLPPDINYSRQY